MTEINLDPSYISKIYKKFNNLKNVTLMPPTGTSLDPSNSGSIMHREGSNLSRCKPFLKFFTQKIGLHLERFEPSWRMIDRELYGSRLVYMECKSTFV